MQLGDLPEGSAMFFVGLDNKGNIKTRTFLAPHTKTKEVALFALAIEKGLWELKKKIWGKGKDE